MSEQTAPAGARRSQTNFFVKMIGFDVIPGSGSASFRFEVFRRLHGDTQSRGWLSFGVGPENDGIDGMAGRAHQGLADALMEMADQLRRAGDTYNSRVAPPAQR